MVCSATRPASYREPVPDAHREISSGDGCPLLETASANGSAAGKDLEFSSTPTSFLRVAYRFTPTTTPHPQLAATGPSPSKTVLPTFAVPQYRRILTPAELRLRCSLSWARFLISCQILHLFQFQPPSPHPPYQLSSQLTFATSHSELNDDSDCIHEDFFL